MNYIVILAIFTLFFTTSAVSQDPTFSWGKKIERDARKLGNIEIVGADKDGCFATYEVNRQVTLEHYNHPNDNFWTTALLPKTPDGEPATFHSVQMYQGTLFMISSNSVKGKTRVYAQEINHNGNYLSEIRQIAEGGKDDIIEIATAPNDAALLVVISGKNQSPITLTLLSSKLTHRWTHTLTSKGDVHEALVQPNGTSYLLTKATAAAPSTTAFYLYQLDARTGNHTELVLGHTNYRPLKAKLTAGSNGSILVVGYMSPSSSVASLNPEPIGTFLYRIDKQRIQKPFVAYTPFDPAFIQNYKRFKPDHDNSQRLRNLRLDKVFTVTDGSIYLLGEVCVTEQAAGTLQHHNNDIIVVRLQKDGTPIYTTSVNKLQSGTNARNTIRSYFATVLGNTLKIIYLDFGYDYAITDKGIGTNSYPDLKAPILVTIHPNGEQEKKSLENTNIGQKHDFYLRPDSAFKNNHQLYTILGIGRDFYKYGFIKF
jgi:hypothetical protein